MLFKGSVSQDFHLLIVAKHCTWTQYEKEFKTISHNCSVLQRYSCKSLSALSKNILAQCSVLHEVLLVSVSVLSLNYGDSVLAILIDLVDTVSAYCS